MFTLCLYACIVYYVCYYVYTEERSKTLTERALSSSENLTQMSDTSHTQDMDTANAPDTSKQLSKGTDISQMHNHNISSEMRPGMSKSTTQSKQQFLALTMPFPVLTMQFPVLTMPIPHNRKHISSPPVSPSSKRSKRMSPVSLPLEAITSQNNVESSITENAADETIIDSSITSLKECYAEMEYPTIIPSNEYHDLLIVDTKEKSIMNLENIGMLFDGTQARCVLIEGSSGVGKTMLLHHLAKQWGVGKLFSQYKRVFLLTLDDQRRLFDEYRRLDLVYCDSWYGYKGISQGENFLFLIDIHYRYAYNSENMFPKASTIFTFRSEWVNSFRNEVILKADQYLKIIGFSNQMSLAFEQKFQDWMKSHPFAAALTYRPLYCAMLIQLCMNNRLPESLPNLTELYRLFIVCSISLYLNKQIDYYSDLQGEDENMFRQLLASSCSSMQHNISEETSFGLVKYNSSKCSRFIHPSISDYFQPLKSDTEKNDYREIFQVIFLAGLQKENFSHKSVRNVMWRISDELRSGTLLIQWFLFETQSSSLENLKELLETGNISLPLEFRLEADPLEWYIAGWCLQNIPVETKLTCDVPYNFNRALCLEMLYNGTKHNPTSSKCKGRLTQITLNGDIQLSECLKWLMQMRPVIENVLTLKIMGTLRSSVEGLNLDTYFPSLNTLDVTSHEVCSSAWQQLYTSLPKLDYLTTLHIRTSQTSEFTLDMLVSLADSIKACCFLKILTFERMSSQFLESALTITSNDPIASSLQSLYILSSLCSDKLVMELKSFLVLTSCKLKQLILKDCTIAPSCLGNLFNTILAIALEHVVIIGKRSIGDKGAVEIAKAIENVEAMGNTEAIENTKATKHTEAIENTKTKKKNQKKNKKQNTNET